ncbi:MAG: hypothetical protein FJ270_02180 [Planctomycetes bacterium]|nr:hypothetical protein [Planctomycetota bacterium]
MVLAPTMLAAAVLAADSIECTPWGGAPVRGTVARADACGVVIALEGGKATVTLGWSEVRSIAPADPSWSAWIEAGDAARRGEQRLIRGDAALAAEAYERVTALLAGARGECVQIAWLQWARSLQACGRGTAAALAQVRAIELSADDALPPWPADLCPAYADQKEAHEACTAFDAAPSAAPRAAAWSALMREVAARQAGVEPKPLSKPSRGAARDDVMRRERLVLEQWLDALADAPSTRQRAREALADMLARNETPVRHWCRAAIGQSLMIEARAAKPGSVEARRLALDAAEQFLTVVACDDAAIPMLSATCAALGAQALDAAGDARGATTVRNRLLQEGTSP